MAQKYRKKRCDVFQIIAKKDINISVFFHILTKNILVI